MVARLQRLSSARRPRPDAVAVEPYGSVAPPFLAGRRPPVPSQIDNGRPAGPMPAAGEILATGPIV